MPPIVFRIAWGIVIGLVVGAALGTPVIGYATIAVGFGWGMFLVPLLAAMLIYVAGRPQLDVPSLLCSGGTAAIAFVVVFLLIGVNPLDGASSIASAALGGWVAGWIAALVAGLVYASRTTTLKGHVS